MKRLESGIPANEIEGATWVKSQRSNPSGDCVELADLGDGAAMRHSRHPDGPALVYTQREITAFLQGVKDGDFDHLLG
jgi:hypothetical protein